MPADFSHSTPEELVLALAELSETRTRLMVQIDRLPDETPAHALQPLQRRLSELTRLKNEIEDQLRRLEGPAD